MSFIRTKLIKGIPYAYVVSNKWKRKSSEGNAQSRQQVSKYLGRVMCFEKVKEFEFFSFVQQEMNAYVNAPKVKIVEDLIKKELIEREFSLHGEHLVRHNLFYGLKTHSFADKRNKEKNIVVEMNEGFLCPYTIKNLLAFRRNTEDERESGIELAKRFLEAGLQVPKEVFVAYYEKS